MICDDIIKKIEEEYPLDMAEEWDNPGLLVGKRQAEVSRVMIALDATEDVIRQAVDADASLLITHHPIIFGKIGSVSSDTSVGRRLIALIEHNVACYAMHTNFDVLGMAHLNEKQLGLVDAHVLEVTRDNDGIEEGIGRIGEWETPRTLREAAEFVRSSLGLQHVRCYGLGEEKEGAPEPEGFYRVAVCGGSGKSVVRLAIEEGAQILVTGDIDYHTAIDALAEGLYIIDAGHYGTEYGFISYMAGKMRKLFNELEILEADTVNPFRVI